MEQHVGSVPGGQVTGLAIDQVGGDVTVGAVHTQIETFVQRALTAAEQAERAREIETRLLARGVGDFARSLQAQVHPIRPLGPAAGNPYKGLLAYDLGDADLFFGRADDIRQLFDRLRQSRLTILQAESGAGKTSLLGAGIAPRLIAAGHLPVLLRPYDQDPGLAVKQAFLSSLADAPHLAGAPLRDFLRRIGAILGPETAVVIFMDQFEEFFVFRKEADRPAFVHALAECLEDKGLNVGWVLALRTESFGRLATFRPRIDPFKNEYYLSQLGLEQARAAVVEPAARHNVTFEPGLVDELLKVLSDRGQIAPPQLQLVCSALYEGVEAEGGVITRTLYEGQGGVAGILNNYLDRVLQRRFFGDMRDQAYAVLTALVTSEGRRARCTRDELASDPASQGVKAEVLDAILPELVNSRLIGLRELGGDYRGPAYELVHDYLAERIQLDPAMRARKAAKELLDDAVEAYRKFGDKALLGADQLAIVEAQRPHFAVNKQAEELLAKSRDVIRRAQEAEKRRARRITWASVGAAIVLLILALMFLGQRDEARKAQAIALTAEAETVAEANIRATAQAEAIAQRDEAVRQANIALARQLAAQAQVTFRQPQIDAKQIGTLLAVESHRRAPSLEAYLILQEALGVFPVQVARLTHDDRVWAVAFSPECASPPEAAAERCGKWVVSGSGNTARVWEAASGREVARMTHDGYVLAVAFSPDGQWVVSGSNDNTARVWKAASGREVARMTHGDVVTAVAFSPDGQWVVSGSWDGTARVWEAASGREVARMTHDGYIDAVAFSPYGEWVASGSWDNTARVWEAASGREVARMTHDGPVTAVAFSPECASPPEAAAERCGKWVMSGGEDNTARVWDATSGREIARMTHDSSVSAVAFSPDGQWMASGSWDGTARVWDISAALSGLTGRAGNAGAVSGREIARMTHDDDVTAVAFSPDGKWVVSSSNDNTARVWEAASGREVARMTHDGYVLAVAFSPDGQWVASGSGDKTARVWEAISRREVARMTHDGDVNAVAFSPDGQRVASGSLDGTARVWEAASGREVARRFHGSSVTIVAFSPDGQWMVSSSADYMVMEAASGREVAHMTHLVAQGGVSAIAFSPECASPPEAAAERCGKWMVSGSGNTARVWEAASGQEVARMTHNDSVTAVAFSPDGKWVVSGGGSTARVWEAASGREVARMTHDDIVLAVAFSPDGQWVVSGSDDNTARVWEAASGREVARMTHDGPVTAVAFSPECASPPEAAAERCGKWVASSSEDRTARVWDATSGREIARMTHDSSVSAVAFSPDGQWVASGSNDNTARVWDISAALPGLTGRAGNAGAVSGREIARMTHDGDVTAVAFSPECASPPEANAERCGKWVVSSSADNTARVWFWQPADMIAAVCAGLPRNFTRAEWKQYLGDEPYRATCPNPLEE